MSQNEDWIAVELLAVRDLTPTVREFRLSFPTRQIAAPGAHLTVRVSIGARLEERAYSVVNTTEDGDLLIAVKRLADGRGGSRHMWSLQPGAKLHATAPVSTFELGRHAPHYLLVAGGIGVTPLLPMARALARRGANLRMVYAAAQRDELAYGTELTALLGDRIETFVTAEGRRLDLAGEIAAAPPNSELYMCGPLRLMNAVRDEWLRQGRKASQLRFETFGASGHYATQPFTVRIPRLQREVRVEADRSMLSALTDAGIAVLSECRRGECGLCALDVIDVDAPIDHRDVFFSAEERQQTRRICACVSRVAGGCITIDTAWRGDPDLSAVEVLAGGH